MSGEDKCLKKTSTFRISDYKWQFDNIVVIFLWRHKTTNKTLQIELENMTKNYNPEQ